MKAAAMRALIVEDDASWQQILVEIITDAGLAVDTVADLEQATACLRAVPHRIAVVDLSLCSRDPHNQDGLAVLDALRRHDPECVSVLLTGFATVELAVQALTEYGALTCLRKEAFNRTEFRALIQQALASARHAGRPAEGAGAAAPGSIAGSQAHECGLALVVDDDAGWRAILSELLSDAGYRVHSCAGYGEALGRLPLIPPLPLEHFKTLSEWRALNTEKARTELGLQTRPLAETVRDALAWFREHGYL